MDQIPTHRPPTHPGEMLLEEFLNPMRLAKFFNMTADFWMNLQMRWDMYHAQQKETAILKKI
jgi:antitoxin HigA-1